MALEHRSRIARCLFVLCLAVQPSLHGLAQDSSQKTTSPGPGLSRVDTLGLTSAVADQLKRTLAAGDYIAAEKLLLSQLDHDQHSIHAAQIMAFAGGVYFLDRDYLNASIAWSKSNAIAPLAPELKLSLAMSYIRMGHADWARRLIEALKNQYPAEAIYPYWLGRIAYDAHSYNEAITHFRQALALAPAMYQGYDGLGLCYFFLNENGLAVENYTKAIELEKRSAHRSAWPYLDLAATLEFTNKPDEAAENLHEAIRIDPNIPQAHLQLGNVLEEMGKLDGAVLELKEAARIDPEYAEPHVILARVYRHLHQEAAAQAEVVTYRRLHESAQPASAPGEPRP